MQQYSLKKLQTIFLGLSVLGIILVVTGMIINEDMFWSIADPITIAIFAGATVVFYVSIKNKI
ncbi:MAG: hypothetical protein J4F36_14305 [Nitrosopumilaceae archaeon]|nr:hypothetical protein [Nitrosopumilaceae archaeon]